MYLKNKGVNILSNRLDDLFKKLLENNPTNKDLIKLIEKVPPIGDEAFANMKDISTTELKMAFKATRSKNLVENIWKSIIESRDKEVIENIYNYCHNALEIIPFSNDYFLTLQAIKKEASSILQKPLNDIIIDEIITEYMEQTKIENMYK